MPLLLAAVMDPPARLHAAKDTTRLFLEAARQRGWATLYLPPAELVLTPEGVGGRAYELELRPDPDDWFALGPPRHLSLREADAVLLRVDPPFDIEYLHLTHVLEVASRQGVLVVNDPRAVRDNNEKLSILRFPDFIPPTLVSRDLEAMEHFLEAEDRVVLKPLDAMGGQGIFVLSRDDPNRHSAFETLSHAGALSIMLQRYLPEIRDGDARILLIDGRPFDHALVRIPRPGETRGNLARGGRPHVRGLTAREREIAETLGPILRSEGLLFVGLDVIGGYLTEINVTSPTGARELSHATGIDIGALFVQSLEERLGRARD